MKEAVDMAVSAEEIIRRLELAPHPEGGHFREVFRAPAQVVHPGLEEGDASLRAAVTSIYYLLAGDEFSAFHRVRSDEIWHLYGGGPMELHLLRPGMGYEKRVLGQNIGGGFLPQTTVGADCWQAARLAPNVPWALCGCTVAPGFDFADLQMASSADLMMEFPAEDEIIMALTRS